MSSRRTARKNAFLALYQRDVTGRPLDEILSRWRSYRGEFDPYAERLARGVEEEKEALDARIGGAAVGWSVRRMSAIDRTIMRLALYEMLHVEDVPAEVAKGEAQELAKGFSSDEAPHFVGGVLRGVRGILEEEESVSGESDGRRGEGPGPEDLRAEPKVGHGG